MIAIIDYGMGNLQSVQKAFEHLGYKACLSSGKDKILNADKVVFPGVGAFKDCMHNLKEAHLDEAIFESIERKKPFLGICLGMQALLTESDEFGPTQGLNCIAGRVEKLAFEKLEQSAEAYKIPHVGWNQIKIQKDSP